MGVCICFRMEENVGLFGSIPIHSEINTKKNEQVYTGIPFNLHPFVPLGERAYAFLSWWQQSPFGLLPFHLLKMSLVCDPKAFCGDSNCQ